MFLPLGAASAQSEVASKALLARAGAVMSIGAEGLGELSQASDQFLGQIPVPKIFSESAFNIVKPNGVERGQLYRRHYGLDDFYYGGKVSAEHGGGGWSGRKLGWTKYGPGKRLWYGTPRATKAVGLSSLASLDALGHTVSDEDDVW